MTIYIVLQGGLGNQLFQYAAGYHLSKTGQVQLIKAPFAHSGRDYRKSLYYRVASVDTRPNAPLLQLQPFVAWKSEDYSRAEDLVIQGYFQYLPAIESVIPQIRQDILSFLVPYREEIRSTYKIENLSSVGFIHVRRGDYLTAPPNLHWIMESHYYTRAVKEFDPTLKWYVLSDDISWCKQQEFTEFPMIEIVDEPDELHGLALMSLCHGGAILANSTYSWWGAMLGAEPAGATVIYPSKWFSYEKPELFPSRWIRL
jgi:hypothetical protein